MEKINTRPDSKFRTSNFVESVEFASLSRSGKKFTHEGMDKIQEGQQVRVFLEGRNHPVEGTVCYLQNWFNGNPQHNPKNIGFSFYLAPHGVKKEQHNELVANIFSNKIRKIEAIV